MYERLPESQGNLLGYRVGGTVTKEDVEAVAAELRAAIEQFGGVRVLVELQEFPRVQPGAMWEDLKFAARNIGSIERMAVVGDRKIEELFVKAAAALTPTEARYFDRAAADAAWTWLRA